MAPSHHRFLLTILTLAVALSTTTAAAVLAQPSPPTITHHHHLDTPPSSSDCDGVARWRKSRDPRCSTSPGGNYAAERKLQQRDRYISYEALRADSIPCGYVGNNYYDCSYHKQLNPYRRGCTTATRCFRYTH